VPRVSRNTPAVLLSVWVARQVHFGVRSRSFEERELESRLSHAKPTASTRASYVGKTPRKGGHFWNAHCRLDLEASSGTVSFDKGKMVRCVRSETLHFRNRCSGVNCQGGPGNLTAILSRIAAWPRLQRYPPKMSGSSRYDVRGHWHRQTEDRPSESATFFFAVFTFSLRRGATSWGEGCS